MNKTRDEKGAISTVVLISILSFVFVLAGIYMINANVKKSQIKSQILLRDEYGESLSNETKDSIYNTIADIKGIGEEEKGLPSEYQEVEYLESTGTQWIDTEITSLDTLNDKIVCETKWVSTNEWQCVFGGRDTDAYPNIYGCYFSLSSSTFYSTFGEYQPNQITFKQDQNTQITVQQYNNQSYIGDIRVSYNRDTAITSTNLYLFAGLTKDTSVIECGSVTIYSFKVYKSSVLVRNLIPCYRKSDLKPGMYDLVNNVFYTNQGTGEFVVGPEVLPDEYQEVEYLESTGTQYIDTEVCNLENLGSSIKFQITTVSSMYNNIYGCYNGNGATDDRFSLDYRENMFSIVWSAKYGNGYYDYKITPQINNNYEFKVNYLNNGNVISNGIVIANGADTLKISNNIYIFAINGLNDRELRYAKIKLMSAIFTSGNKVIRNLVPCYRKCDNKPGLYDTVNNQFYTNQGTGEFNIPSI